MQRKFITAVEAMEDHVLRIDFISGSHVMLNMRPHLDSVRFYPLNDPTIWSSATTNGLFVRFGDVELAHDEIIAMLEIPGSGENQEC